MLRFAPSPTGDMHVGNLRVAIYNYIMARKLSKRFIVRIEDTDLCRNVQDKGEEIVELIREFGIQFDEVVYQSERFPIHRDLAMKLVKEGKAFYCFCSKEFLDEKREEARRNKTAFKYLDEWATIEKGNRQTSDVIRIRVNEGAGFSDLIKGYVHIDRSEIDSFVIMRGGIPTYNFACAVDDKEMHLIIRGEDHLSNTPKQIIVKRMLGFNMDVKYAHIPIILNSENKKMSKRDNESSVRWLLQSGIEHKAIVNYLTVLGNSRLEKATMDKILPHDFCMEESMQYVDISNIARSPAQFDYKRILQINREIIRRSFASELDAYCAHSGSDDRGAREIGAAGSTNHGKQSRHGRREKMGALGRSDGAVGGGYDSISRDGAMASQDGDDLFQYLEGVCSGCDPRDFVDLIRIYLNESSTRVELRQRIANVFLPLEEKRQRCAGFVEEFDTLASIIRQEFVVPKEEFPENYDEFRDRIMGTSSIKGKAFFKPLRSILSGEEHGVELSLIYNATKGSLNKIIR